MAASSEHYIGRWLGLVRREINTESPSLVLISNARCCVRATAFPATCGHNKPYASAESATHVDQFCHKNCSCDRSGPALCVRSTWARKIAVPPWSRLAARTFCWVLRGHLRALSYVAASAPCRRRPHGACVTAGGLASSYPRSVLRSGNCIVQRRRSDGSAAAR